MSSDHTADQPTPAGSATETMTVTFTCAPGQMTPEFALECQKRVVGLLQAIADDIQPGGMTFHPKAMQWIDDGKDEIVVTVVAAASEPAE